jgi:hypothetical protein
MASTLIRLSWIQLLQKTTDPELSTVEFRVFCLQYQATPTDTLFIAVFKDKIWVTM